MLNVSNNNDAGKILRFKSEIYSFKKGAKTR